MSKEKASTKINVGSRGRQKEEKGNGGKKKGKGRASKSPQKKEVGETLEEKETRKALLKVWYAGQQNI